MVTKNTQPGDSAFPEQGHQARELGALLKATKAEGKLVVRFGRLTLDVVFPLLPKHDSEGNVMAMASQSAQFFVSTFLDGKWRVER